MTAVDTQRARADLGHISGYSAYGKVDQSLMENVNNSRHLHYIPGGRVASSLDCY